MPLFADETGAGDTTVALIHGFGGGHAVWSGVARRLSDRYRVLAYDLPGHGGSHPWPETGTPRVAVKALLADLDKRGIDRVHLAGHSMGGAISVLMAMAEPSRIASLTLFAPGGFGVEINARVLGRYAAASTGDELRACLEAMRGWDTPVSDAEIALEQAEREKPGQTDALAALAASITRDGKQGEIPRDRLAQLTMPVAVAWGTIDNVLPVSQAAGLPPSYAVHILPGIGHMLPIEASEFCAGLIARSAR